MATEGEIHYHGGVPGLRPGDRLLPPDTTGVRSAKSFIPDDSDLDARHVRTDRVFITTSQLIATMFAAMYPEDEGGWLYAVLPVGEVEQDPDHHGEAGESLQVAEALVVAGRPVTPTELRQVRRVLLEA